MNIGNKRKKGNRFLLISYVQKIYFNNFSLTNYTFCHIVYRQKKNRDMI